MARFRDIRTNFTGGEISPLLKGRVDIEGYSHSVETLKNFIIQPQGGITRRGGWHFVGETKYQNKETRLIPYEYSSVQAYVLEFGDHYIRFYMDDYQICLKTGDELVLNGTFLSDLSNWAEKSISPGTTSWDTGRMKLHGEGTGVGWREQAISITVGKTYCLEFNVITGSLKVRLGAATGGEQIMSDVVVPADSFKQIFFTATASTVFIGFRRDSPGDAYLDNVTLKEWIPYEIYSPYTELQLDEIQYAQDADTLYLTHPQVPRQELVRETADDDWSITESTMIDGPYYDQETSPQINPGGTTGDLEMVANGDLWYPGHVGAFWRIGHYTGTPPVLEWGYVKITSVEDTTHCHATVISDLKSAASSDAQREGSWNTYNGFPSALAFFEGRLLHGGSPGQPQTFWGSKVNDYSDMTPGIEDDDAYYYTLGSGKMDIIRWLASTRALLIGTTGGEHSVRGGDTPVTPSNINSKSESTDGSYPIQSLRVGSVVLFIQKAQTKLIELAYLWESDSYSTPDLTILAEHLFKNGIKAIAYQQEPIPIVWAVTTEGLLCGMTYIRSQKITGWHQHPTQGEVLDITAIPNPYNLDDRVWGIVKRTVQDVEKKFVEYLDPYNFTDSSLNYDGSPVSKVGGMTHLIGETVQILGDGSVYPPQVVDANGSVDLDGPPASIIECGLEFIPEVVTLPPEIPTPIGTSQGVIKHWSQVWVRLHETIGIEINGEMVDFRIGSDSMDEGVPVFTGDKQIVNLGRSREAQITLRQPQPLPITVVCVFGTVDVGD